MISGLNLLLVGILCLPRPGHKNLPLGHPMNGGGLSKRSAAGQTLQVRASCRC